MGSISVDPAFLVINECIAVTSAMRKNARWAQSGVSAILGTVSPENEDFNMASKLILKSNTNSMNMDNPLIVGFAKLRSNLAESKDVRTFSAEELLSPFLEVISSPATTGVITSIALAAVGKFFSYGLISKNSVDLERSLYKLATAITHCRFEATDQNEDDAVLLRILSLMEEAVCKDHGPLLPDESVCEIVETCLSMACQMRRGDLLRRSAEITMVKLTQSVFSRLQALDQEDDSIDTIEEVQMHPESQAFNGIEEVESKIEVSSSAPPQQTGEDSISSLINLKPCGVGSLREILRVLISILDPSNFHQYTDSTRVMSLRLINVSLEVSGAEFARHASLLNLATTSLCKHLFQLIRYDNPSLVQVALRVISTMLHTNRIHLKMQQELFFTYVLTTLSPLMDIPREPEVDAIFYDGVPNVPKLVKASPHPSRTSASTPVAGGKSTPTTGGTNSSFIFKSPEVREIMIESLTSFARMPYFFTSLFLNYDCDVDRTDLFEDLIGFLCRNAYPDSATWSTANVPPLCLEALLSFLASLNNSLNTSNSEDEEVKRILDVKAHKKVTIFVTDAFNENPKKGLALLVDKGIVKDASPSNIAKFLKESGRVSKKVLGEFLSKPANKQVMELFIEYFDFSYKRIDEALREFLSTFRLPGESQQIEQIFEKFADQYCKGALNTDQVANNDSAFILSYAVIMLNTDLHNPQIKKHMTIDQFKSNLRGSNNGKDFSPEYLEDIYRTIKSREIIMPDEHDNDESFEYSWKEMMLKTTQAGELVIRKTNAFDKYLFEMTWLPIVTTLAYVFATATDDTVFSRVIRAFDQAARIASHYQIGGVTDHIVECLSKMSTLSAGDLSMPTTNCEIQIEDDESSITVSDLSIAFGSDFKAQTASVILFRVTKSYANMIQYSWKQILPILANLYLFGLITPKLTREQMDMDLPMLPKVKPQLTVKRSRAGRDVGLFSTLSSYLTGGYSDVQEPSDEDVDSTLSTIDCIKACGADYIFSEMRKLNGELRGQLIDSILETAPLSVESPKSIQQSFYASTLFFLELASVLTAEGDIQADSMSSLLANYIHLFKAWESLEPTFLFRSVACGLSTIERSSNSFTNELQEMLTVLSSINSKVLASAGRLIIGPMTILARTSVWCSDYVLQSTDYWTIVKTISLNGDIADESFKLLNDIIQESPTRLSINNFDSISSILSQIASIGASGARVEQKLLEQTKTNITRNSKEKGKKRLEMMIERDVNRSLSAIKTIHELKNIIDDMINAETDSSAWKMLWYPYIQALSSQCVNPCRKIRNQALTYFEQVILSDNLRQYPDFEWPEIFDKAIFPLISTLLKPEVYDTDPERMPVTRLHVASLLCKIYLQYVVQVQQRSDAVLQLWIRILDTLDRLVHSGQRDTLKESVVESLKNVLLVVQSSEFGADEKFWNETWKRVDNFLPGLRQEFLAVDGKEKDEGKQKDKDKEDEQSNENANKADS